MGAPTKTKQTTTKPVCLSRLILARGLQLESYLALFVWVGTCRQKETLLLPVTHRAVGEGVWAVWLSSGLLEPVSKLSLCVGFSHHLEDLLEQEISPGLPDWWSLPCPRCYWQRLVADLTVSPQPGGSCFSAVTYLVKEARRFCTCRGSSGSGEGRRGDAGGFGVCVPSEPACVRLLPQVSKLNQGGFKGRKHLLFPLLLPTTYPAGDILLAKMADGWLGVRAAGFVLG